ncbi:MAG TPA: SDR family NAD(P)-dependent oxidoreductase [Gemmatimonadales bacterium]|nr:SDR family NAD(P)-dependent oxidoreductase [Gemmatimonadales bacterium]
MIDFQDRVAIVTGAGRGLGAHHARLLATRGAAVVVNDPGSSVDGTGGARRPADEVAEEIVAAGGAAVADHHSVADPEGAAAIVQRAVDEFGRVDILVNNAGILRDKAFHNLEWENLDAVLDVHLKGAFYVTRPAFRQMREQGYGRIVMTTSNAGVLGNFGQANYGAAKMGLVGLMNVLKVEGAKYDIKVNTLAPVARTRMTEELLGPVAEKLDPALVSPVVAYLCSEACAFSGDIWSVAGGTVSRFFIGLTPGYFKNPDTEGALTVEDVAGNVEAIRGEDGYLVPWSVQDELTQKLAPKLFG